jgi:hypothetical protein
MNVRVLLKSPPSQHHDYISRHVSSDKLEHVPPFLSHQRLLALSTHAMSQTHPISSSSSNFQSILNAALDAYEKKTESELLTHPLAAQLESCDSPTAIISVLQDLIQRFDRRRRNDQRLTGWLKPTVTVLYAFSATLSQGAGLVRHD